MQATASYNQQTFATPTRPQRQAAVNAWAGIQAVNEWRADPNYTAPIIQPRDQAYVNASRQQAQSSGLHGYHPSGSGYHYDHS